MKVVLYCALISAVAATVTSVTANGVTIATSTTDPAPSANPQRTAALPIRESVVADTPITLTFAAGAVLPAVGVGRRLIAVGGQTTGVCPTAINDPRIAVIGVATAAAGQAVTYSTVASGGPPLVTGGSLYNAYGAPKLIDGGMLCFEEPLNTFTPVNALLRLFYACNDGATARTCGTFVSGAPALLSHLTTVEYTNEVFGKKAQLNAGSTQCECYNSNNPQLSVCGTRLFNNTLYTCCNSQTIVPVGTRCSCTRASTTAGSGGISTQCPTTSPNCCFQAKYTLPTTTDGVCFDPTTEACCDTGFAYNKGTSRCCRVNGIQSLDIPCPCETDDQCSAGNFLNGQREAAQASMACCVQSSPALTDASWCSTFVNFPLGQGDHRTARCKGFCINTDYQLCCNGVACLAMYEKCCNTTCCNRFIGTCDKAKRPDMSVMETCSTIQQMNPLRAFWLFIFPAALLFSTLTALALALIFANKAASREFSVTERAMIIFSVLLSILIIPLYFSPLYKYGLFMVLVAAWTILTAAVRVKLLNIVAVILYIILFVYLFDPFTGSQFLNLAYFRDQLGNTDFQSNGIWHTTKRLAEPTINGVPTFGMCTNYFDYFVLDERLRDFRIDNYRVTTFGYCSNQYILALYLFEGFQIIVALVLTVLSIIGLVLRFRKKAADPIELEVVPQ